MKQAVMTSPGVIELKQVDIPELKNGDVLIKIRRIGICGSDVHVYHGKHPYTTYPVVQGHEVSGEIVKISDGIKNLKIGDKVTIQPQVVCGVCYPCTHGQYHICDTLKVMGFQTVGMASEFVARNSEKVLKLPDSLTFDKGALVEPVAVACHALRRTDMDMKDKKVLVFGAGPIGNLVAQTAKAKGAKKIIITDISPFRLEKAKKCGIDVAVDTMKDDLNKIVKDEFGLEKADVIIECAGVQASIKDAINIARKGTSIIIVAVYPADVAINMGFIQDRELKLIGTLMYQKEDYLDAIRLISDNKINCDEIITDHFAFEEYPLAYKYIEEQKDRIMKVVVKVTED